MVFVKAQILNKLGDKEGAIAASKHSTELAEKANDGAYVRLNAEFMSKLKWKPRLPRIKIGSCWESGVARKYA